MRSGIIAKKLGMTRIFTETGEHIPVTVLQMDNCQVVAQRSQEKNGYTALWSLEFDLNVDTGREVELHQRVHSRGASAFGIVTCKVRIYVSG